MTVSAQSPINQSTGNGVTTVFPYTFKIINAADIEVTVDDVVKTLNVDYTVSGAGADAGGNVTMTVAPASSTSVVRRRNMALTRTTDYQDQGALPAATLDADIDNVVLMVQQVNEQIGRALTAPPSMAGFSGELPTPVGSNVIGWNPDGTGFQNYGPADSTLLTVALAAPSGSSIVGYMPAGTGAVATTVQAKLRESVSVKDFGAVGDGITDDAAAINLAITAASGKTLVFPSGSYLIASGLNFTSWTGQVIGSGKIVCKAATTIANALYFSGSSNIEWDGVSLDMGQTSGTLTGGARSVNGFYLIDARDCTFDNVRITNCKFGQPVYIDGTSSVSPGSTAGSKRIFFNNLDCVALAAATLDDGAFINVRSDFYTATGGGLYAAASNGCKEADYTLDATVAYQRTTENIYFNNCNFENLDRFALYNVKNVHLSNVSLLNNYTRGLTMSPCCENISWVGGKTSGNAAQVNANYACKDITISNLIALGETVATGQRHSLRCGFGSQRIKFSNITGSGNDTRHVFVEGATDVTFENVSLNQWTGGNTTVAVSIAGGGNGNTSNWVTDRIKFIGCDFSSNYAFRFDDNTGTATVADGAVTCDETCRFNIGLSFWNGVDPVGKLRFHGSGAWTPTILGESVAGTQTYTTQQGKYRRKGDVVYVECNVKLATKDAAMAGNTSIGNLPFTVSSTTAGYSAASVGYANGLTFPANFTQLMAMFITNSVFIRIYRFGSGQTTAGVAAGEVGGTSEVVLAGQYIALN